MTFYTRNANSRHPLDEQTCNKIVPGYYVHVKYNQIDGWFKVKQVSKPLKSLMAEMGSGNAIFHFKNIFGVADYNPSYMPPICSDERVELLSKINGYRKKILYQGNLNDKDWTVDDLRIECERLGI